MAKQKISNLGDNPTREEIEVTTPPLLDVAEDKSEEIEDKSADKSEEIADISEILSHEIAEAAKEEKKLKELEVNSSFYSEDEIVIIEDESGEKSGNGLLIGFSALALGAGAFYLYVKNKTHKQQEDDKQLNRVPQAWGLMNE